MKGNSFYFLVAYDKLVSSLYYLNEMLITQIIVFLLIVFLKFPIWPLEKFGFFWEPPYPWVKPLLLCKCGRALCAYTVYISSCEDRTDPFSPSPQTRQWTPFISLAGVSGLLLTCSFDL